MKHIKKCMMAVGYLTLMLGFANIQAASHEHNPCNPCGAKKAMNPCNPCGAKKAKNPCNPCGKNPCNPCGKKAVNPCNPCGGKQPENPCAGAASKVDPNQVRRPAGTKLNTGPASKHSYLLKQGKQLFNDTKLSSNGLACQTCHANNGAFMASFVEPYPHMVKMANEKAGMGSVGLDEMVQLCMVVPMEAKPLPWDSEGLAALTVYTAERQKEFQAAAVENPCALKKAMNPCNPCGAKKAMSPCNPCGAKKAMNPCNPCGAKKAMNPCNPCAGKK